MSELKVFQNEEFGAVRKFFRMKSSVRYALLQSTVSLIL